MGCYYTLCHNTYAYSLLFYKVYMKREKAGSWNFGLKKEQTLETYYAQLQKPRNFTELHFRKYKKYLAKEDHEGGHLLSTRVGGAPPLLWARPLSRAHPMPIFGYMESFVKTNNKQAHGTKLRRHEAEPWRNQSRALVELFCRGNFPPGGGNLLGNVAEN